MDPDCHPCRDFLVLRQREHDLLRWLKCPTELDTHGHGYISTQGLDHVGEQGSVPGSVNQRIDEIDAAAQVPWLDFDDQGHWQVWQAVHGVIPPEVTRSGSAHPNSSAPAT